MAQLSKREASSQIGSIAITWQLQDPMWMSQCKMFSSDLFRSWFYHQKYHIPFAMRSLSIPYHNTACSFKSCVLILSNILFQLFCKFPLPVDILYTLWIFQASCWIPSGFSFSVHILVVKGPLCDPNMHNAMTQSSRLRQNKLISLFSVNSEVVFVSYMFYCIVLLHTHGLYHVKIKNQQFGNSFVKQMNLQEIFCTHTHIMCLMTLKISTFLEKIGRMRLWNGPLIVCKG